MAANCPWNKTLFTNTIQNTDTDIDTDTNTKAKRYASRKKEPTRVYGVCRENPRHFIIKLNWHLTINKIYVYLLMLINCL